MIELERHIEILLLNNDCVIVPELGGFMAYHIDARHDEAENLFLPPLRSLGFNPQLKINDSLLVQSYIEAYDISYPEALQRITDEVNELKIRLKEEGLYELNDIGTLSVNDDGNYQFTPCEAGILTPSLYGLDAFEISRRPAAAPVQQPATTIEEQPQKRHEESAKIVDITPAEPFSEGEQDDDDVVKIKFSWIRNTIAVAAVLLAIFILALPTGKTEMMTRTISNLNNSILFGMMSEDTNTSKIDIKKIDIEKEPIQVDTLLKKDTTCQKTSMEKADSKEVFCIVLASYVTQKNAQAFVEDLQKRGYDKASVYIHNKVTRVIFGNYKTESDAYTDLRLIHRNHDLSQAWVMKMKSE